MRAARPWIVEQNKSFELSRAAWVGIHTEQCSSRYGKTVHYIRPLAKVKYIFEIVKTFKNGSGMAANGQRDVETGGIVTCAERLQQD